jgi:hypothetical protein
MWPNGQMTLNVPVFGLDSEETATREVTSGVLFEIVWSDDRLRSLLDCRA